MFPLLIALYADMVLELNLPRLSLQQQVMEAPWHFFNSIPQVLAQLSLQHSKAWLMDGFVWSLHLGIVGGRCKHNGPITVVLNLYLCKKHGHLLFHSLPSATAANKIRCRT